MFHGGPRQNRRLFMAHVSATEASTHHATGRPSILTALRRETGAPGQNFVAPVFGGVIQERQQVAGCLTIVRFARLMRGPQAQRTRARDSGLDEGREAVLRAPG